jgi:putative ABC transport system substrate-binding protein
MSAVIHPFILVLLITVLPFLGVGVHLRTALAEDPYIAMLTSQEAAPYKEVLAGFRQQLSQNGTKPTYEEYSLQGDTTKAMQAVQEAKKKGARVLLTVGSLATQAALKEGGEIPVIACLVLNANELQKAPNATGVVADFPLEMQFEWMHRLMPGYKTVGVLFNPKENRDKVESAARVAQNLGLKLVTREVQTPQDLPQALDSMANQADALWGVADQMVLSPQTAEPILLFSFRNRIPFAGLSTSWVKAGALYALDRDYTDLGAQCGEMAVKVLQGARASSLPLATPRKVLYSLNLKTANHMKLDIPQPLIDGAQQVFR